MNFFDLERVDDTLSAEVFDYPLSEGHAAEVAGQNR